MKKNKKLIDLIKYLIFCPFLILYFLCSLFIINCGVDVAKNDQIKESNQFQKKKLSIGRPNIILIIIDSLRRDHLGYFGYFRSTSPFIDRLCQEGVVFRNVIAQSSQTGPAITSLWTGLYPYRHGIQLYSYNQSYDPLQPEVPPFLDESLKTMAEYLKENGYFTMAFVGNPWLHPNFNFAQGFDLYLPFLYVEGQQLIDEFKKSISGFDSSLPKPFFAYIHLMDTHDPYVSSSGAKGLFVKYRGEPIHGMGYKDRVSKEDLMYAIGLYDEQICYVDDLVSQMVNSIKNEGLAEDTLLILAPDHGEEFYEHFGLGHGVNLYNEVIDIFLLFHMPKIFSHKEINSRVQVIDLLPTLLELLDIEYDQKQLDGKSFLPLLFSSKDVRAKQKERIALVELGDKKAIIQKNLKYIYNVFLHTEELYDLGRDSKELRNMADKELKQRERLKDLLFAALKNPQNKKSSLPTVLLKDDLLDKLRALGYIKGKEKDLLESTEILRPISYEINFSSPFYNPLQLVYGWKEKIMDERGIFYRIGPFVKLVLKPRKNLRKDNKELIIEGQIIGNLSSNYSVIMEIYAEMNLLCQYQLPLGNNFSIMVYLPKNFGINRAVEFLIAWRVIDSNGASIIPEVGDEVFPLISRILWN